MQFSLDIRFYRTFQVGVLRSYRLVTLYWLLQCVVSNLRAISDRDFGPPPLAQLTDGLDGGLSKLGDL
jgi:hypothetical protein